MEVGHTLCLEKQRHRHLIRYQAFFIKKVSPSTKTIKVNKTGSIETNPASRIVS